MPPAPSGDVAAGQPPIRSLWPLYLYASDLYGLLGDEERVLAERTPDDLPDLAARVLARETDARLRRDLTTGYVRRHRDLTRVRGRVDHLGTAAGRLMERGRIACRFDELTVDTARNRLVLAALTTAGRSVTDPDLAHECRALAAMLLRLGVTAPPGVPEAARAERFGRHDRGDRLMVSAARMLLDRALPGPLPGPLRVRRTAERDHADLERLFGRAVRGLCSVALRGTGWTVGSARPAWDADPFDEDLLPELGPATVLTGPDGHRLLIRAVFEDLWEDPADTGVRAGRRATPPAPWLAGPRLRREVTFELAALVEMVRGRGTPAGSDGPDGMDAVLIAPRYFRPVDVRVGRPGRHLRYRTVDLDATPAVLRAQLLTALLPATANAAGVGAGGI